MANKGLFTSTNRAASVPAATTTNAAGGRAYEFTHKHALAQIACTNTFNGTFYADAETNLQLAKDAVNNLRNDAEFVAKVAVYARSKSYMKDMPAYLVAWLAAVDTNLFKKVFPKVIDNGKMLRNFMQIGRSGQAGKKLNMSSGAIRTAVNQWFANRSAASIFRASIGNDPSMRDMLRMARPKPKNEEMAALFAYLKGAEFDVKTGEYVTRNKDKSVKYQHNFSALPEIVRSYELFKKTHEGEIPNVDFRLLDSVLTKDEAKRLWASQAQNGSWQTTRMNLNNFQKYGVFDDRKLVELVAQRLANKEEIVKARAFPYQLLMAYHAATEVPAEVREALQDAMEASIDNVPALKGKVYVCVDTSGSMKSPITGTRVGSTTKVRCVDVAGLIAAAVLRNNKLAEVLPFDTKVHHVELNPRDSVMTNAVKLARNGGGTDCSCALKHLNDRGATGDAVFFVSDNESWVDSGYGYGYGSGTGMLSEWTKFKARNPKARLICTDLTPRGNSQVNDHKDILQVGGWSDTVFDVVASFIEHGTTDDHWVNMINSINLDEVTAKDE